MNFENTENLMDEEPPPILSSEIREVFYLFANMLDIKSFMKLAMASKEMYERCMQDKMIKLKLTGWDVHVEVNGAPMFSFYSPDAYKQKRKYLEKVRQLKCHVSLRRIRFEGDRIDVNAIMDTRRYLETLNVKTIESLMIDGEFVGWQEISFIKDYQIRNVEIDGGLPDDVLRSLLQSNLNSFSYNGPVQGDLILQVDSTIPEISLPYMKPSGERIDDRLNYLWSLKADQLFHRRYVDLLDTQYEAFRHKVDEKFFIHFLCKGSYQCTRIDTTATGKLVCARCSTHNCVHVHAMMHHMEPHGYAMHIGRTCIAITADSLILENSVDELKSGSDFASDVVLRNTFKCEPKLHDVVQNIIKSRGDSPYLNHANVVMMEELGFATIEDYGETTSLSFRKLAFGGPPIISCHGKECQENESACRHILALIVHMNKLGKCEDIVQHTIKLWEIEGIDSFSGYDVSIEENNNVAKDTSCLSSDFSDMSLVNDEVDISIDPKDGCMDTHNHIRLSDYRRALKLVFLPDVPYRQHDDFFAALRKFPCKVNLRILEISDILKSEISVASEVLQYMKEIGVNKVHELRLYHDDNEWETILAIIKDFDVKTVIQREYKEDILRSFLQLNLEKLTQYGPVPVDFILEIDSPIQEIFFPDSVVYFSKEQLIDILAKIQSGSLHRLTVDSVAVNWNDFHSLPFNHEGPLPDDRPLLLEKTIDKNDDHEEDYYHDSDSYKDYGYTYYPKGFDEYWFLHWHGGVTKCEVDDYLAIFKCEPWDYPWILRKEEDILNNLAEKRPRISCSANQFNTFCKSLTMIDYNQEGSLPNDRPLYFKIRVNFKPPENNFWMLGEDDNLMECTWKDGFATWKSYDPVYMEIYRQPALSKYMFWKVLKQEKDFNFTLSCKGIEEFNSWFEDCEKLDFEYSGVLPSSRPLVFERASSEPEQSIIRVVLFDDRLLQCEFSIHDVSIKRCHYLNRPPILFRAKNVLEMLQDDETDGSLNLNVQYEEFLDGLNQFKRSSLVLQKRILITELVADEFWYWMEDVELVRKVAWKQGRLSLIEGDLCGSPSGFMKQIFKYYAQAEYCRYSLKMDFEELNSCLEQFSPVPFEYSGPLTSDSSLAFVKKEIRHMCDEMLRYPKSSSKEVTCQCSEVSSVLVWLLWDGKKVNKCSWGEMTPKEVLFDTNFAGMPPAFKSKEYLKFLLQEKYDKSTRFEWFGSAEDFRAFLEDYMKLPFDYDDLLPDERPLLFEKENKYSTKQFLLRSDGTTIKCSMRDSSVEFSLLSSRNYDAPRALKNII